MSSTTKKQAKKKSKTGKRAKVSKGSNGSAAKPDALERACEAQLLSVLPLPLFVVDRQQRIRRINVAAAELVGTTVDEATGKSCQEVFGTSNDCAGCAIERAQQRGRQEIGSPCEGELRLQTDGKLIERRLTAVALLSNTGAVLGAVGILLDVTEELAQSREITDLQARMEEYHGSSMELAMGISECFEVLAEVRDGNLSAQISQEVLNSEEELMAKLGQSVNATIGNLRSLAAQAKAIAMDRLDDSALEMKFGGDLGEAFRQMTEKLRTLAAQADAIAHDDLDSPALQHAEAGTLGTAFERMVKNLRVLTEQARAIAGGKAEIIEPAIRKEGSLGSAFGRMADNLRNQMNKIGGTAQELKASAAQILAIGKETEGNAADEASAVDETLRTMRSLLTVANEIADGAQTVLESADRSSQASNVIGERIEQLNAQALKITDISDTIRSIADKSDILALNASLEGTKAGEVGRGFALVGAEMRRLAETVKGAVRQIKQLSREIQDLSRAAVLATEEGQKLAAETKETSRRIALACGQQRSGTEQVSLSMKEIQHFTQQALSGAKQARSTAAALVNAAEELGDLLRHT